MRMPRRIERVAVAMGLAVGAGAGDAAAQSHYLLAQTNGSFHGASTNDVRVDPVHDLYGQGVSGVNPSF